MSLKQFFIALFVCTALLQTGLHCARAQSSFEVRLEDESGNTLPTFQHRGQYFAMGQYGQRYNVRVVNHSGRRVEAVVTVDGRDVLSGQPGDYKMQRGYLIGAYDSVLIEGFRTSLAEVAAFRFTSPGNSYSTRMGTPENVGVIGAAFFPEAPPPPPPPRRYIPYGRSNDKSMDGFGPGGGGLGSAGPERRRDAASDRPAPATSAPAAPRSSAKSGYGAAAAESSRAEAESGDDAHASNIGTEYGEAHDSSVVEVPFQRASPHAPERLLSLRYDDRSGLEARGIVTRPRPARRPETGPVAFPVNRFAPPPPYWR